MDLKVVCLLFGCLLSIALAQGEEGESEEGGCRCEGKGGRGRGGWGGPGGKRGGKGGGKRCHPMSFGLFKECKEFNEKLCESIDKEEMKKCWEMDGPFEDKHECMVRCVQMARDSFGEEDFPDCLNAVSRFIDPEF